jgi:nucleotide-binding universal stress UspA family protein
MTDEDLPLLRYTAFLARALTPEAFYFIHVVRDLEVPDSLSREYPELTQPVDENLESRMRQTVATHLGQTSATVHCEVHEGSGGKELLHWLRVKDIDLMMVGGFGQAEGDGSTPLSMVRKAPCSVLVVPPGSEPKIESILVPVDFSAHSALALEEAVEVATRVPGASIACGHIFDLPSGYSRTGRSEGEFTKIMKDHARRHFEEFVRAMDLKGQNVSFFTRKDANVSRALTKAAARRNSDLVISGGRGRTAMASWVVGSVTEGLVRRLRIPVLAVKKKSEGMGLVEALLKM